MQNEILMAGFGGQGVMTIGKFLAEGALENGQEVAWIPSYGPEMRGGTAYCTVVVADRPIGSPVVNVPTNILVMNRPSMAKFEPVVKPGGALIVNSSLVPEVSERTDILQVRVPCNDLSIQHTGTSRSANIAGLGGSVGATDMVPLALVEGFLTRKFKKNQQVLETNLAIFKAAYQIGAEARAAWLAKKGGN
jgi:2-oxoglutarate ferredoxin oxidoreductase subunit gamma